MPDAGLILWWVILWILPLLAALVAASATSNSTLTRFLRGALVGLVIFTGESALSLLLKIRQGQELSNVQEHSGSLAVLIIYSKQRYPAETLLLETEHAVASLDGRARQVITATRDSLVGKTTFPTGNSSDADRTLMMRILTLEKIVKQLQSMAQQTKDYNKAMAMLRADILHLREDMNRQIDRQWQVLLASFTVTMGIVIASIAQFIALNRK
jgi:hypothetical protein